MIANHYSASLSEVDLEVVRSVPPGGNWKDIPLSVPSKRLEQIRASFRRGEGSRSTYYGRLRPDAPSYTINTYFSRPGNGCHIHYAQDRVLSQREAARLQSFPDSFEFVGSRSAVSTQIGNAVPPLLAYQIALQLGEPGCFVDLFAGAGGLSLGFVWAGWEPLVANDLEPRFLETYAVNIHSAVLPGDIRDTKVSGQLVDAANEKRRRRADKQFIVLGGPPCQGFSTAGNRRTVRDERNRLFENYRDFLDAVRPDGFVFENVTGLLNMEAGKVFRHVHSVLAEAVDDLVVWSVQAEEYAVPQRRARVILVGRRGESPPEAPIPLTAYPAARAISAGREVTPSVEEALGDLPALSPGEDGSGTDYGCEPQTDYQRFVRGAMSASEFLAAVRLRADAAAMSSGYQLPLELTPR